MAAKGQKAISAVACYLSGPPPIAEVPFAVYVPVLQENVSAHGVLQGDNRLSQNPELAILIRMDLLANPPPEASITLYAAIAI
jgi:hypothetical protein